MTPTQDDIRLSQLLFKANQTHQYLPYTQDLRLLPNIVEAMADKGWYFSSAISRTAGYTRYTVSFIRPIKRGDKHIKELSHESSPDFMKSAVEAALGALSDFE